ncbi:MAG: chorismate synthase [Candidatus Rifleibacteriota bacterium]
MSLRILTAGESHGPALCGILDGMPAGVEIEQQDFDLLMQKRWAGYGRGKRKSVEIDLVEVLSGIVGGKTIGSPISLLIRNQDYARHKSFMQPFGGTRASGDIPVPLPGHADFAGAMKFGLDNCRYIRERASARETAMRTALSVPARNLLRELGIDFTCFVEAIGGLRANIDYTAEPAELAALVEECGHEFLTPDKKVCDQWKKLIDDAGKCGRSLGGTAAVIFWNLPVGLGSHTQADLRLDSILSARLMSIPGVRGVEIGQALEISQLSSTADPIEFSEKKGFFRPTNFAAGIEGGISNGQPLVLRIHMKAPPGGCRTGSVDLKSQKSTFPEAYRSDTQAMQAVAVVAESVTAIELASQIVDLTGGTNMENIFNRLGDLRKRTAAFFV